MTLEAKFNCLCRTDLQNNRLNLCVSWQPCPLNDIASLIFSGNYISISYLLEIARKRKDVATEISEDKKKITLRCLKPAEQTIAESGMTGIDPISVRSGELLINDFTKQV